MAFIPIPSSFKSSQQISLSLSLSLFIFLFFFITRITQTLTKSSSPTRRSILTVTPSSCSNDDSNGGGILNYHCIFPNNPSLSIPTLSLFLLLHFYILIQTAQRHFSTVTTKLASHLNLSPSMAAVTLLSLGNGSPDVFSSLAALRAGQYRTGFGAILSAGAFVSALVVGFVAIYAAPFSLDPAPFVRDLMFYLTAALFLFYVYLSAEIFLWQAIGFVAFYLFFVGFVFYMDLGIADRKEKSSADLEAQKQLDYDVITSDSPREEIRASGSNTVFHLVWFSYSISILGAFGKTA